MSTDQTKVELFDQLLSKYCYLTEKLKELEQNCESVNQKETSASHSLKNRFKEEGWEEASDFPDGWQSKKGGFNEMYRNSDGNVFQTFYEAVREVIDLGNDNDVKSIFSMLKKRGWESRESLPRGWMVKKRSNSTAECYLTDSFKFLQTFATALSYLKSNDYSQSDIDRFLEGYKLNWKQDPDLPDGWRLGQSLLVQSLNNRLWMDSEFKLYSGIAHVVKNFLERDLGIEPLRKFLAREGWFQTHLLPPGCWLRQKLSEKSFYYMTPDARKFTTTVRMIQYLKEEYKWEEDKIQKFQDHYRKLLVQPINPRKRMMKIAPEEEDENISHSDIKSEAIEISSKGNIRKYIQDPDLPEGWKVAECEVANSSSTEPRKYYKTPENRVCSGIGDLVKSYHDSGSDIKFLEIFLVKEGWLKSDLLPPGFWIKAKSKGFHFLTPTPDVQKISSLKFLFEFLRENYKWEEERIHQFRNKFRKHFENQMNDSVSKDEEAIDDGEDDTETSTKDDVARSNVSQEARQKVEYIQDPDLPDGWKILEYQVSSFNQSTKIWMAPDKKVYQGMAALVRAYHESGDDVQLMETVLQREGWFKSDLLPSGCWMRQRLTDKSFDYMTPDHQRLNTTSKMIRYLRDEYKWEEDKIEMFQNNSRKHLTKEKYPRNRDRKEKHSKRRTNLLIKSEDQSVDDPAAPDLIDNLDDDDDGTENTMRWQPDIFLPEGWRYCTQSLDNGLLYKRFMSPAGQLFGGLASVLKKIFESGDMTEDQMETLRDGLEYEGWSRDITFPGWWSKRDEDGDQTFLSPSMRMFFNQSAVKRYIEDQNQEDEHTKKRDLNEDDMLMNLREMKKNREDSENQDDEEQDPFLPQGWRSSWAKAGTLTTKTRYQKFTSPAGRTMNSRAVALRTMIQENYPEEDISLMKEGLIKDGWTETRYLPAGWLKRQVSYRWIVLSPDFFIIKSDNVQEVFEKNNLDMSLISDVKSEMKVRSRNSSSSSSRASSSRAGRKRNLSTSSTVSSSSEPETKKIRISRCDEEVV